MHGAANAGDMRLHAGIMKHVVDLPSGGWDLQGYFGYLAGIRERLPPEVYSFAVDPRNYDLESHQSLHDAWLDCLSISEPATGARSEIRSIQIDCRFLGPYHDLDIHLTYFDVADYSLTNPADFEVSPTITVGHGDLLMHEVRLADSGLVIHELRFSRGSIFRITCATFSHRTEVRCE